ncbi:MAG: nuclear transport factor 2 family protein [Acidimicrobiales bacterium]
MAEHPNIAIVGKAYEAFAANDIETVRDTIAEDATWHVGGYNPFSGEYKGRDEILGFFASIAQDTGGTLRFEVHGVLADDEHAVVMVREQAERKGKGLDAREVHVYHVNREGQATEFWEFTEDQRSYDAFWSA